MIQFDWGATGLESACREADGVVIVDVLSFSTTVSIAVERGAIVFPYPFGDESAEAFGLEKAAVVAVARSDITGSRPYSLSPSTVRNIPRGARLVLPSPNGAACCVRALELGVRNILTASLRNARATATAAASWSNVAVIAAGERRPDQTLRFAIEDYLCAGAVISLLPSTLLSAEAEVAKRCYEASASRLDDLITASTSGQELIDRGYADDVSAALERDVSSTVAEMRDGALSPAITPLVAPQGSFFSG